MSIIWSEQDTRSFLTARGESDDEMESDRPQSISSCSISHVSSHTSSQYDENDDVSIDDDDNDHDDDDDEHHQELSFDHDNNSHKPQSLNYFLENNGGNHDTKIMTTVTTRTTSNKRKSGYSEEKAQQDSHSSSATHSNATHTTATSATTLANANAMTLAPPPNSPQGDIHVHGRTTTPPPSFPPSLVSPFYYHGQEGSSRRLSPRPPIPTSILRPDIPFSNTTTVANGTTGITANHSHSHPDHHHSHISNSPFYNHASSNTNSNSTDLLLMSPMASVSLAEDSTRTLPQHVIDLQLRMDQLPNTAWVYIPPWANTASVRDLVHDLLLDHINPLYDGGGRIVAEYDLDGRTLEEYHVIDCHFGCIAKYAMMNQSDIVGITTSMCEREFKRGFGEDWAVVCQERRIWSGREAMEVLRCDARGLYGAWNEAEVVRLGTDLYCGKVSCGTSGTWVYVLNGFYMAMRNEYLDPYSFVHAYVIQWNADMLPWKDFLTRAIGSADPSKALPDSLRRTIHDKYRVLELEERPNELFNAVHASESPLEGLAERLNWSVSKTVDQDVFGRVLLGKGIPESKIMEWCRNSKVSKRWRYNHTTRTMGDGMGIGIGMDDGMMDIYDVVKGTDTRECLNALIQVYDCELFGSVEGSDKKKRKMQWKQRINGDSDAWTGGCCVIC